MDNFRGFHKTWLPLNDVNFFVGENSTGKTSVMSLIYLLSTQRFWEDFDFSSDYGIDLGIYDEITHSEEFTIGIIHDSLRFIRTNEELPEDKMLAAFLKFIKSEDGSPRIVEYNAFINGHCLSFLIDNTGEIWHKIWGLRYKKHGLKKFLHQWLTSSKSSKSNGYRKSNSALVQFLKGSDKVVNLSTLIASMYPSPVEQKLSQAKFSSLNYILEFDSLIMESIYWLAPIRSKPQRIYERRIRGFTPEGDHIPFLLRDLADMESPLAKRVRNTLENFGQESGLFQNLAVRKFGEDKYAPFEIQVSVNGKPAKITNVGYGISQVLPLIVEIVLHGGETWFAMQQPEVHLHPKAQAFMGEFIHYQAKMNNQRFIVETHSDFILDRFRLAMKRFLEKSPKEENSVTAQILFFERTETENTIHAIGIAPDGSYLNEPPASFREFFINESLEVLGI